VHSYSLINIVVELVYINEDMEAESLLYLPTHSSLVYSIDTNSLCRQKLKHHQKVPKRLLQKPAKGLLDPKVKKNTDANEKKLIQFTSTRFLNKFTQILAFRQKLCRSCKFIQILSNKLVYY
jgi:hypothetical protein